MILIQLIISIFKNLCIVWNDNEKGWFFKIVSNIGGKNSNWTIKPLPNKMKINSKRIVVQITEIELMNKQRLKNMFPNNSKWSERKINNTKWSTIKN